MQNGLGLQPAPRCLIVSPRSPAALPMKPSKYAVLAFAFLTATLFGAQLAAQPVRPVVDTPYPGTLTLQVDATDLNHRIFRVKQTVPVRAGPLTLFYPRWLPGNHGPRGVAARLAGLKIRSV
jgi:hypothetical protein